MKTKLLYILLITLILSNSVMIFMLIRKPHMTNNHNPSEFLLHELNLTETQKSSFKKLSRTHHKKIRGLEDGIRKCKELLFKSHEDNEKALVDSIATEIGKYETIKYKEIDVYFKSVNEICNEDQEKKFHKIISRGIGHRPPKGRR